MSDESPTPYSQESNPPDSDLGSDGVGRVPAKRRYRRQNDEEDASIRDLDEEIEGLNARLQAIQAERRRAPAPPPGEESRGSRGYRLTRKNPPTVVPRADGAEANPAPAPTNVPPPARPAPLPVESLQPLPDLRWLYALLAVASLAGTMFYLGRVSVGTRETAAGPAKAVVLYQPWSSSQIADLEKILAVDQEGNPAEAFRLASQFKEQTADRNDFTLYQAYANARAGRVNDAESETMRLADVTRPPLASSAAHNQLAFVFGRRRDFRNALDHFQFAAEADPFNPRTFYHWGEALRRQGRLEEAIEKFRQTLLRAPTGQPESASLRECAAFRWRLCLIELGRDADLKASLDERLRTPAPGVYWWLTAAAYYLQRNEVPAGVDALTKAALAVPREQWEALLEDYLFRGYANRIKEVATFLPPLTSARRQELTVSGRYLIDP